MDIEHRVTFLINDNNRADFAKYGIFFKKDFDSFIILESDKRWPEIQQLMFKYELDSLVSTRFTKKELAESKFLRLWPSFYCGYPGSSHDFEYKDYVYDSSVYCNECGIGEVQKAPYEIKSEPKWGAKSFCSLYWVDDEFFVKPEVWEMLFKGIGIDSMPVLHYRTKKVLSTIVQLVIPKSEFTLDKNPPVRTHTCPSCGRIKITPEESGYSPALIQTGVLTPPIFRVADFYGHGHMAINPVIITQDFFRVLQNSKIKGYDVTPLASL